MKLVIGPEYSDIFFACTCNAVLYHISPNRVTLASEMSLTMEAAIAIRMSACLPAKFTKKNWSPVLRGIYKST